MSPLTKTQRDFVDYLLDFYGYGGVYTKPDDPFSKPMTRREASRAARALSKAASFEGDTIDREKARELVIGWRGGRVMTFPYLAGGAATTPTQKRSKTGSRASSTGKILYETPRGHITLEPTGKSLSYFVWLNGPTAATHIATFGMGATNAFERAKDKLK